MTYAEAIAAARAAYGPDPPSFAVLDPRAEFLRGKGGNCFSQYGEDGLIAALFERIGTADRCCWEVGASDGVELSNTKALRDDGWHALLIEADAERFLKLALHMTPFRVATVLERITPDSLNRLLESYGMRGDDGEGVDLGVIDIDGEDVKVFEALRYCPRVLLVEYNALGDGLLWHNGPWQAGIDTVVKIGRAKGYAALARTSCNVLFCLESALRRLTSPPGSC